jgi:hypothetical protein
VARWLTVLLALTLAVTLVSSWMSADGGLDMGDPPPVAMPDPSLLEAPEILPTSADKKTRAQIAVPPRPDPEPTGPSPAPSSPGEAP